MKKNGFGFLLLCFIVITAFTGCSNNVIGDGGLISEDPCGPPCFMDVNINVSTKVDVLEMLDKNKFKCEIQEIDYKVELINCPKFQITLMNEIVYRIQFNVDKGIKLGDIINLYGEPDFVRLAPPLFPDEPFNTWVLLPYNKYDMTVELSPQDGSTYVLSANNSIKSIIYWSFEDLNVDYSKSDFSWVGYTEYSLDK